MPFVSFELEEWQSRYETSVQFNLADSGVQPVALHELVATPEAVARLLETPLHYPPVNGTARLRERIAAQYRGARAENVLVTVGAAEANAITVGALTEPGDHVIVMEPGYRQVRGVAANAGCEVDAFHLRRENTWRPDLDELDRLVRPSTRLIAVTNPNNPVGTILTAGEMDRIVAAAGRSGAWLFADEVYRGTERVTDRETESFFGRYDRVVATGSLSKAYGLSGLRTGWVIGPAEVIEAAWRRHEYATISTGMLSMVLAEKALTEPLRTQLLDRNRRLIRSGYERIEKWIAASEGLLSVVPPAATALAFVRYALDMPSLEVAHALRERASVLVGAGAHFGVEHHLRITHGLRAEYLEQALGRISETLQGIKRVRTGQTVAKS
jgi:aspartate/methionine/tyrosine aminotransferase